MNNFRNFFVAFDYNKGGRFDHYIATLDDFKEGGSVDFDAENFILTLEEVESLKADVTAYCEENGYNVPFFVVEEQIGNLEDFANYINTLESYPNNAEDIIAYKGWELGFNDEDICYDLTKDSKVIINEDGEAEVVDLHIITPDRQLNAEQLSNLHDMNTIISARKQGYNGVDYSDAWDFIADNCTPVEVDGRSIKGSYNTGDTIIYEDENGWEYVCTGQFARTADGRIYDYVINSNGEYLKVIA